MKSFVAALRTLFLPYGQPITAPQVIINEDPVRADLQALYSNKVVADFIFQKALQDYIYQAFVSPAVGKPFLAFGGEDPVSAVVSEAMAIRAGSFGGSALNNHSTISFSGQLFTETSTIPRGLLDANVLNAGLVAASALTTEVVVPSASWLAEPTFNFLGGQMYELGLEFCCVPNSVTDSLTQVRIRKGSAALGGQQLGDFLVPIVSAEGNLVGSHSFKCYVQNQSTATVSTKLTVTNQRNSGAATINLYGDANLPMILTVRHLGRFDDSNLSLVAAAIV